MTKNFIQGGLIIGVWAHLLAGAALREVVVSHTDDEEVPRSTAWWMGQVVGDSRFPDRCRMPSCSSDGKKLVYVEQVGHAMALRFADLNGGR